MEQKKSTLLIVLLTVGLTVFLIGSCILGFALYKLNILYKNKTLEVIQLEKQNTQLSNVNNYDSTKVVSDTGKKNVAKNNEQVKAKLSSINEKEKEQLTSLSSSDSIYAAMDIWTVLMESYMEADTIKR